MRGYWYTLVKANGLVEIIRTLAVSQKGTQTGAFSYWLRTTETTVFSGKDLNFHCICGIL